MKKEWILLSATALVTTTIFLGLLRWLAPQPIGIPAFYEGVFREERYRVIASTPADSLAKYYE